MGEVAVSGRPRILVVGCGGVGGIVCASLIEQGCDVTPLTRNPLIADAINLRGFRTQGADSPGAVPGQAVTRLRGSQRYDLVLLATQPTEVEAAARQCQPHLADDGIVVCFQNGLCEERVAAIVGADHTLGAIVTWGASMIAPGVYDRTSGGGFVLGWHRDPSDTGAGATSPGQTGARMAELARVLEAVGPVTLTENLRGARYSKLALNCAISTLGTIGGDRLGVLLRERHVRRLALEVMSEAVEIARAEGVRLEKVAGTLDLEWIALDDDERRSAFGTPSLVAKHALLLAVGARYRRLRSSMLAAIERGQAPAIDFLNGEIVSRGERLGIATPVNRAASDLVRRIAARKERPSHRLLRGLFDATRGAASAAQPTRERPSAPREGEPAGPPSGHEADASTPIDEPAVPPSGHEADASPAIDEPGVSPVLDQTPATPPEDELEDRRGDELPTANDASTSVGVSADANTVPSAGSAPLDPPHRGAQAATPASSPSPASPPAGTAPQNSTGFEGAS